MLALADKGHQKGINKLITVSWNNKYCGPKFCFQSSLYMFLIKWCIHDWTYLSLFLLYIGHCDEALGSKDLWPQIMSRQGDGTWSHINFEGQLINICKLTYMNDSGVLDENHSHPCDPPKFWEKNQERG